MKIFPHQIDPNRWKNGGLNHFSSDQRHGNARTIYSRDFPATVGSQNCGKCKKAFGANETQCPWCK